MLCTQFYITFMLYNIIIICHMSQFNLCVKNSLSTWKIISKTTCTSTNLLQQSLFTKLENFNTQTFVTKNVGSLLYIVPYHNYNRQTSLGSKSSYDQDARTSLYELATCFMFYLSALYVVQQHRDGSWKSIWGSGGRIYYILKDTVVLLLYK